MKKFKTKVKIPEVSTLAAKIPDVQVEGKIEKKTKQCVTCSYIAFITDKFCSKCGNKMREK